MIQTSATRPRALAAAILFFLLAVLGLFYAKWEPYYVKALAAAHRHSLGPSILTGHAAAPPAASWAAAWTYTVAYLKAIWLALVVGLVLGAGVQALLPRDWLLRLFRRTPVQGVLAAGAAAVPSMMCTCCSAPVAVGLVQAEVPPAAVLAYWVANPVLNPATIVFIGFVLGWRWAALRMAAGVLLVAAVAYLGARGGASLPLPPLPPARPEEAEASPLRAFGRALFQLAVRLVPEYLVIVALLGGVRAWLFPAVSPDIGGSLWLLIALAAAGTLFVIPTAGEVPIVQTLSQYGLGAGPAGALLVTLPAVSLPSLVMVGRALPARLLAQVAAVVFLFGLAAGLGAWALHL